MPTKVFWTEPTEDERRWLRRYVKDHNGKYTCNEGWHEARKLLGDFAMSAPGGAVEDHTDWPTQCSNCDYQFTDEDVKQVFTERLYEHPASGERWPIQHLPPGAMYDADWYGDWAEGPDGIHLMVVLPTGHQWMVDAEASNCTRKGDRTHRCWIRHGDPRTGNVHVDKDGDTCAAGAGSIAVDGYHGFLHNGVLTDG